MGGPDDFDEIDTDAFEEDDAAFDCGLIIDGSGKEMCMSAGTEWCDFECPYRDEAPQFRQRKRKPAPTPLLDLMEKKQ